MRSTDPAPRPAEGVISWNINTSCNYRCHYCTQRFKDDRSRWSKNNQAILAAFGALEGQWEIKISGGEPFVHPEFLHIVAGLASLNHRISIVTNFSASHELLKDFVNAAQGRVGVFSCSLHPEYVDDITNFLNKVLWLEAELGRCAKKELPSPHVAVTAVATRQALPMLAEIKRTFQNKGICFKLQPEKQGREVIQYTQEEADLILSLGGHNLTGKIVHRYKGRLCWAGSRYFILDDVGAAYRCYPARRYKIETMGNFLEKGFRLEDRPRPCLYETCNCSVPIARGMIAQQNTNKEQL